LSKLTQANATCTVNRRRTKDPNSFSLSHPIVKEEKKINLTFGFFPFARFIRKPLNEPKKNKLRDKQQKVLKFISFRPFPVILNFIRCVIYANYKFQIEQFSREKKYCKIFIASVIIDA
jgi:hypothetical protein